MTLMQDWIAALRSGDYTQTGSHLRDETGFCCLGVLCDIINPDGWTYTFSDHYKGDTDFGYTIENDVSPLWEPDAGIPPLPVLQEVLGLPEDPIWDSQENPTEIVAGILVVFNDLDCLSFEEIADWLEQW